MSFILLHRAGLFRWLALLGFALTGATLTVSARPIRFDIPAQPAAKALLAFSKQSGADVLYSFEDLKSVRSHAVAGDFEPAAAIKRLLEGTDFSATQDGAGKFVVARTKAPAGRVTAMVVNADTGAPAPGVSVAVEGTALVTVTDARGEFRLVDIPEGTQSLVLHSEGFLPTRVTEVEVKTETTTMLATLSLPPLKEGVTKLTEYVVSASKEVLRLDPYEVTDSKAKPFATGNLDIPRTINDVQPYYIFDANTIDHSGATNLGDFLNQRLTMNTVAITNSNVTGINLNGTTSSINLRGVGTGKTLILVDGRRLAAVTALTSNPQSSFQVDFNGIPLSAVYRVEVLPVSASGIYGGSAIGGVVNVILKKDYHGGEIRTTYDTPADTNAARRQLSVSYGWALEGGRTHVNVSANWSDELPLLLQDRNDVYLSRFAIVLKNSPSFVYSSSQPHLGSLPNIQSQTGVPLTLKPAYGGGSLNSALTYVPAGTSPTTSAATLGAGLLANAGRWDLDSPPTPQNPNGLLRQIGTSAKTKAYRVSVDRQMTPWLELYADFNYNSNVGSGVYNQTASTILVTAASPINPFNQNVYVVAPDPAAIPVMNTSLSRSVSAGALLKLPWEWNAALDYTYANSFSFSKYSTAEDVLSFSAAALSGAFNPFVDSLQHPLNFAGYQLTNTYFGGNEQQDITAKASGPLPALPWGTPSLTTGLEYRLNHMPRRYYHSTYPVKASFNQIYVYNPRDAETDAGYLEATVPLIKQAWLPGVYALELQGAGRLEKYTVDTGTPATIYLPDGVVPTSFWLSPTLNGKPFFAEDSYSSKSYTAGLKYQPIKDVVLRVSTATAFTPPDPGTLVSNPSTSTTQVQVTDPKTNVNTQVYTISGGNPNLVPQDSKSTNIGLVWQPSAKWLEGLRLDAEYYRIQQFDAIVTPSAQTIVNMESLYPGRVVRNSAGTITTVDISSINLYQSYTSGWDLSADYMFRSAIGEFNLHAVESILRSLKTQYNAAGANYDAAGFSYADQGAVKYKSNATLDWAWHRWSAGWTVRYVSSYKQYGAAGSPSALQNPAFVNTTYIAAQGGDTVPSQSFHDVYLAYAFGERSLKGERGLHAFGSMFLSGLTVQAGVRNVFNKAAAFDAYDPIYASPYGDYRLRSIWVSVRKAF